MTKYVIFRKHNTPKTPENGSAGVRVIGGYERIGEHDGNDAKGAIKAAVLAMNPADQAKAATETFAAAPIAYWREESPKVETTTVVSFARLVTSRRVGVGSGSLPRPQEDSCATTYSGTPWAR